MIKSSFKKRKNNLLRTIITACAFIILAAGAGHADIKKQVLILHSYHYGMNWADGVIQGIKKVFADAEAKGIQLDVTYEFMDTKKYSTEENLKHLHRIYKYKYKNNRFEVIIASDDAALNFLLKYRNEIFGKIPVVFTGINFFSDDIVRNNFNYTGVVEEADVPATIDLALRLHPKTKKIVVVGDQTITSVMDRKTVRKAMGKYPGIEFEFLETGDVFFYQRYLQGLPETSIILAMHVNTDNKGKYYSFEESFDIYALDVKRPIYTFWDFYMNRGALGGMIVSGEAQGSEAAKKTLLVLKGQPVDTIPVLKESPNQYIFDFRIMKKFNIGPGDIPAGAIIINKPKSFRDLYEENREFVITVIIIIIFLSGVIFVLTANIIKRKKAEKVLLRTNRAYERFVPSEFLHHLGKNDITMVELGDQVQKDMSILFSDIRSFTTISEKMTPAETFNFINEYLGIISPLIRQCHGFIDKYIGDAIMAIFPVKPEDSVKAAIEMQKNLIDYNIFRKKDNRPPVSIGIGIHTGLLMLGTVGETKRMEGTVISDTVNLSSRLEGLTKHFGANIIISDDVKSAMGEESVKYNTRFLGKVKVKGKDRAIGIHQVIDGNENSITEKILKTRSMFEKGLNHYYGGRCEESVEKFGQVLKINPDDVAALYYMNIIKEYTGKGVPEGWTGIIDMQMK